MRKTLINSFFLSALCLLASCRPGTIIPQDLKCEWMTDPRVVDVAEPRLSWINEVEKNVRNEVQTAYRILVASSEDLLEEGNVDMWLRIIRHTDSRHLRMEREKWGSIAMMLSMSMRETFSLIV